MSLSADQIAVNYPTPTYRFRVSVDREEMLFNAVSGLVHSYETIEYKDGLGGQFQMPGQRGGINISLKRGVVRGQAQLYEWISSISLNQVEKKDISITLTNDAGTELLLTWNVVNAFPIKLTAPDFNASTNEFAIEQLDLVADRFTEQIWTPSIE
ncbi:phage tail protein [Shewanella salipaludis]|uniref:Phage tail protein n=1 Tax=Shewanella salipaludis TaxID=2723052 RepID=A0A972FW56_9GAMM|nr:phage tail protein [Shewanella salipaludis]NMH66349.1 phage tail protein [Shewanella salipaludis]